MERMLGLIVQKLVRLPLDTLGLIHQLLERLLGSDDQRWKAELKLFLRRQLLIHTINCDARPRLSLGWKINQEDQISSAVRGQLIWNPDEIKLYLADEQKVGSIQGRKLCKNLEGKRVLDANVLDFLLAHPELIPQSWQGHDVSFWGTIYRDPNGWLYVRSLFWTGQGWVEHMNWLGGDWFWSNQTATLVS